jgi:acyl-CoA synthetase (AMP-forming)/AMP-acid ligase II/NAD(P)-dependent dehydrogenase (short-subunit alcohol dehydrogenase family)/alpha-ketoglutarate-dependent taurine dioxygenase
MLIETATGGQLPLQQHELRALQGALRAHPSVDDCIVLRRQIGPAKQELVAYVVTAGPFDHGRLEDHLRRALPSARLPGAYVPVVRLPLDESGRPDVRALEKLEVVDAELARRWEEAILAEPGVKQAAVVIHGEAGHQTNLHLSDLLAGWTCLPSASTPAAPSPTFSTARSAVTSTRPRRAISEGEPLRDEVGRPRILSEALRRAADLYPANGIRYVRCDGSETHQSHAELVAEAERILGGLRRLGLAPGDKVIFQLDRNQDFIATFWACVLGGFVTVPLSIPPTYDRPNGAVSKLQNAWLMLGKPLVLCGTQLAPALRSMANLAQLEHFHVVPVEELRTGGPDSAWHAARPGDLAVILLTSGSSGQAKGVMQCHESILNRSAGTAQLDGFTSDDISLNWFPLDHVGGLVMFHLRDVYIGCQQIQVPTQAILEQPLRWLELIDRHRVTITWAPNFAFGLVNAQKVELERRCWDLSSLRFILNGGEAIVPKTARRFLELLAPQGLPSTAMRPAWGMSETCSGVTSSDAFTLDSTSDEDQFVDVGQPIPGVTVRIADAQNHVVEESTIGRLQVKGTPVTSGYYQNPELNRDAFTADGWFNTGDLGFLRRGRLTITGRQKDVIIINGVNYYCQEIEAVVEELPSIEVSWTAACAVRNTGANTDSLAIFFHSPCAVDKARLATLLADVRGQVVRCVGVNPTYLVPLEKGAIPKTEIGKIQRAQLRQRFEAGEFAEVVKQVDVASGNTNTLPDWFFRRTWRRKKVRTRIPLPNAGRALVFCDLLGLGSALDRKLSELGVDCVRVEPGTAFSQPSPDCYRIDPRNPGHYRQLFVALAVCRHPIDQVLHLWTCDRPPDETAGIEGLEQALDLGVYSILQLSQNLARGQPEHPVRVLVVSNGAQQVLPSDAVACEWSPILGLVRTVSQEMPGLTCSHLDLPADSVGANVARVLRELGAGGDAEVAYRRGHRLVPRLANAVLHREANCELPFRKGGRYLLTGGLGGIGVEVARFLLVEYRARLLLIGRTPLPPRDQWASHLDRGGPMAERVQAFRSLEGIGGDVRYAAADVAAEGPLRQALNEAEAFWGRELDGIIHLAGAYQDLALESATHEEFAAILRPKVHGTWTLNRVIAGRRGCLFVSFSSVLGIFGGAMVGAYASANRFLDSFAHRQRNRDGLRSYAFAWGGWNEVGMNRGNAGKEILRSRGIQLLSALQGLYSLQAGLSRNHAHLLIGLDDSNLHVRRHLEGTPCRLLQLRAYLNADEVALARLQALVVRDRFQTASACEFVYVPQMPMTPSGAIDRSKLVELGRQGSRRGERVAARSEEERRIAIVWQEVLGVPDIGVHDNFFELGGHSLLATRVLSRIRDVLGVELQPRDLFESPTVARLAKRIASGLPGNQGGRSASPLVTVPRNRPVPLSFTQLRLWFIDQLEPGNPVYNIPAAARLRGPLDFAALEAGLGEIIRRHEALRTTFRTIAGRPVQVVSNPVPFRLPITDLSHLPVHEREAGLHRLTCEQSRRTFELARDLLLRPGLLRLSERDHVLMLAMHHIASDGWSLEILYEELAALYRSFASGRPCNLPPLPIQYVDYTVWQRQWLKEGELARLLAYWKQQLAGAPACLELAADRRRPALQTFRGALRPVVLPRSLADAVRSLSLEEETTQFMTLLAAFQALLGRLTGKDDICVGSPISGRTRTEIERPIGFFANTLVLRTDLSGNPTFRELLQRVRGMALDAYAHGDLPFEKLVEALRPPRDLSRNPLVQVNFRVRAAPPPHLELSGLDCAPVEIDPGTARFDFSFDLWPNADGFGGYCEYCTDLFGEATITKVIEDFAALLSAAVNRPDRPINDLTFSTNNHSRSLRPMSDTVNQPPATKGLRSIKRKAVDVAQTSMVKTSTVNPDQPLPLVLTPALENVDLADWAGSHRAYVEDQLHEHGAILFRGFGLRSPADFECVAHAIYSELYGEYGDLPREGVAGKIYGSTPYPNDKMILYHNESSHMHRWPMKISFYCVKAAEQGGATPIVDCRAVYRQLDPAVAEQFAEKGLLYVRNFSPGLDVDWKTFFHTDDRAAVENSCRGAGMTCEWTTGHGLRVRQLCKGVRSHPKTGEKVFFNQVQLHHVACLEPAVRESLLSLFREEDLPRNVYFGDGSRIDEAIVRHVGEVYERLAVRFPWREGDMIVIDNMLSAHARDPFFGSRKIVVAMGEMVDAADLD